MLSNAICTYVRLLFCAFFSFPAREWCLSCATYTYFDVQSLRVESVDSDSGVRCFQNLPRRDDRGAIKRAQNRRATEALRGPRAQGDRARRVKNIRKVPYSLFTQSLRPDRVPAWRAQIGVHTQRPCVILRARKERSGRSDWVKSEYGTFRMLCTRRAHPRALQGCFPAAAQGGS